MVSKNSLLLLSTICKMETKKSKLLLYLPPPPGTDLSQWIKKYHKLAKEHQVLPHDKAASTLQTNNLRDYLGKMWCPHDWLPSCYHLTDFFPSSLCYLHKLPVKFHISLNHTQLRRQIGQNRNHITYSKDKYWWFMDRVISSLGRFCVFFFFGQFFSSGVQVIDS